MRKKNIIFLLGPNLNMVGIREKSIYGEESADSIRLQIISKADSMGFNCNVYQSNWEGALIDKIHECRDNFEAGVINPGALSHYSYALRDAVSAIRIPFIEVHMSNIYSREDFRRKSIISDVCVGQITGFGKNVYFLALQALKELI